MQISTGLRHAAPFFVQAAMTVKALSSLDPDGTAPYLAL